MNNSIDGIGTANIAAEQTAKLKETAGKVDREINSTENQNTPARQQSTSDQVVLTESAQKLQAIEQQLKEVPVVDRARTDQIKQQIADGSFQVNAESIADKLLAADELIS